MSRLFTLFGVVQAPLLLITLISSPWLSGVATTSLILMIMVVGLHLFSGNSGVLAFGHVAFVEIGAYPCGILTIPSIAKPALFPNLPYFLAHMTIPPQAGVLVVGVVAAVAAVIVFFPLRRLNAQALSIVTLAIMGVAGGIYALSIGSFSGADFFIDLTILLFAMMVVGGMRSLSGAVIGAAVISIASNFFSKLQNGVR